MGLIAGAVCVGVAEIDEARVENFEVGMVLVLRVEDLLLDVLDFDELVKTFVEDDDLTLLELVTVDVETFEDEVVFTELVDTIDEVDRGTNEDVKLRLELVLAAPSLYISNRLPAPQYS